MNLMKEISEQVNEYDAHLEAIVRKIDRFDVELVLEKRLGFSLEEAEDYYMNGNKLAQQQQNDTIDFQPQSNVEKPIVSQSSGPQRLHLIYDARSGKLSNVIKTDIRANPGNQYVQASQQQIAGAIKHMRTMKPELVQRIQNGSIAVWVPRDQMQDNGSNNMLDITSTAPLTRGMNTNMRHTPATESIVDVWKASGKKR